MPGIEVREGETINDAIKRLAKEIRDDTVPLVPDKPTRSRPRKPAKSAKSKPVTQPDPTPPVEEPIYCAVHLYQRPDEPEGVVESNARRERNMHGPNTLVFKHLHQPGVECTADCREKVL